MEESASKDCNNNLYTLLGELGLQSLIPEGEVTDKLKLLQSSTETLKETKTSLRELGSFIDKLSNTSYRFEPLEKVWTLTGLLLSDIGKTGNLLELSTPEQRQLIFELYSIRNIPFIKVGERYVPPTVGEVISDYAILLSFKVGEAIDIFDKITEFKREGVETNMKEFWKVHVQYTYNILSKYYSNTPEIIAIASQHHFIEGCNPGNRRQEDDRYTPAFGRKTSFGKEEILVMLFDKYFAFRDRSNLDHRTTIQKLHQILTPNISNPYHGKIIKDVLELMEQHLA